MTIARRQGQFIIQDTTGIRQMMLYLATILLIVFLSGCAMFSKVPMDVLIYDNPNKDVDNPRMFVFLRGLGGSHQSFEEEGLVADVLECGLPFNMAAPNAHYGYYGDRNLITRLKEDVIDPALARGCKKIWLVGFSMGGLGAMLYLMERPEDIAGVYLISPFLGTQSLLEEIEAAGGVRNWDPGLFKAEEDWQRMLWDWMKTTIADNPDKIVYLGYGKGDPYKIGPKLLADILPPNRVYAIDGGHDYQTFKALWKTFLENASKLRN